MLGMALAALGRHDEVLQEMRVAIAGAPQSAMAHLLRAEALVHKGDLAQATASLETARELDPSDPKLTEVQRAIDDAARAGHVFGMADSTGTKEYPASKQVHAMALESAWSEESSVTEPPVPAMDPLFDVVDAPPTQETAMPPAIAPRTLRDVEESTTLDPDPFATVRAVPVPKPPAAALRVDEEETEDVERYEPSAPLFVTPQPPRYDERRGPSEPTRLGNVSPPPAPRDVRPRSVDSVVVNEELSREIDAPPARADRVTRQQDAIEPREPGRDPSMSTRNLDALSPRERPTFQTEDSFSSFEATSRRDRPSEPMRVTRPVDKVDDEPRSFASGQGSSDPSISLSSNEIVFVPDSSAPRPELSLEVEPLSSDDAIIEDEGLPPRYAAPQRAREPLFDPPSEPAFEPPREPVFERPRAPMFGPPSDFDAPRPDLSFHPHNDLISDVETQRPVPRPPTPEPRPRRAPSPATRKHGLFSRMIESLPFQSNGRSTTMSLIALFASAAALAVIVGLAIREWRLRAGITRRYDLAQRKLGTGNFAGFQAAELLYKQILAERDDSRAAVLRAKVLAQLAFEFGEPAEAAARAVGALPSTKMPEEREARMYLELARGELDVAQRQAAAYVKDRPGPAARYLLGEAQVLLDQPEDAVAALLTAAAEDPQNPMVLHGLGIAEAASRHPDRALDAYARALVANPNHVATIIDRALLQLREGIDRDNAAGSLEGVVSKLVGDASPSQLARAYVGLAEIELGKGNVAAARSALNSAAARRRDDPLLLEELAQAYADAFELDPAEREARRALSVSGRLRPRLILADVALRRSRPVQALAVLEESGSSRPEALVLRALAKLELGRTAEARTDAELALRLDPASPRVQVAMARVEIAEQKYDAAQRRLENIEATAKTGEVEWALGQVALARRSPDRARSYFRSALVHQPLLLEARLALARLLHDSGQLAEARDEVNHVLAINAEYVPARRELASIALDLGDPEAARDELDALADRDADLDTLLGDARAHLLLGDARGAEDRADRAMRLRPTGADLESVLCMKARALLLDHRPSESIQALMRPVKTALHGEIVALFVESYIELGRLDWAVLAFEVPPIAARTGIELQLARAHLAIAEGKFAAASSLTDEALVRLRSGRSPVWLRAQALALSGEAQIGLGQNKNAVKSLKSALELDPRNARAFDKLGTAWLELKRYEDAAQAFESATKFDNRLSDAQYWLGWTRRALGDARSDEALRAYLALEPRGPLADDARRLLSGGQVTQTSDRPRNRRSASRR